MNGEDVRSRLHDLVAAEPPRAVGLPEVMAEGRRLRRRRRCRQSVLSLAVALGAALVAAPVVLDRDADPPSPPPGTDTPQPGPGRLTPLQQRIVQAITATSPPHWTFAVGAKHWYGADTLDGTADDGKGPGRLLIEIVDAGAAKDRCGSGHQCTKVPLEDGSTLSVQDAPKGDRSFRQVVLTHRDGSAVLAQSASYVLVWPAGDRARRPVIRPSRSAPVYSVGVLEKLVLAIDRLSEGAT